MKAPTGGKTHRGPEARRLRVPSVLANGAGRGLAAGGRLPTLAGQAPRKPRRVSAPRPVPTSAHPLARPLRHPRAATHSHSAPPPLGPAASRPPRHHPPPRGRAGETRGARGAAARAQRPGRGRGRGGAYLPWASRMAACDSAGTWPPPPSPGLETWRAGTKMAAPPNFHCYFGHSSSYFLGTRLPPCDGSGGNGTGTRLRHGGGRAEGEREREGREGKSQGDGGGNREPGRWGGTR